MKTPTLRYVAVLGLLTATGPLAIDMYLPALPAMGVSLHAANDALQATLMSFYLALGIGQLVAGPISDAYGRKRPLYFGLLLYVLASIGCAFAADVHQLVFLRLLQGLGACAAMVTPRAVVRDLHTGAAATRMMVLLMTIYSVSPLLAPLVGSLVAGIAGWRAVFGVLAAVGALGIVAVATLLPETRPPAQRTPSGLAQAWAGYGTLLRDRRFLAPALMAAFTMAGFFMYVGASPFVFASHYGVSPRGYALLFALNVVPYVAVAQTNGWLVRRFSLHTMVRAAVVAQLVFAAALWLLFALGMDRLPVLQAGLMLVFSCTGVLIPGCFVLAMDGQPRLAGSASALIGALNFAGGALAMGLAAPFSDGTPLPMLGGLALCAVVVFAVSRGVLRHPAPAVAA